VVEKLQVSIWEVDNLDNNYKKLFDQNNRHAKFYGTSFAIYISTIRTIRFSNSDNVVKSQRNCHCERSEAISDFVNS